MAIPLPYSALIDASTSALLLISNRIPIIVFLTKAMSEADHAYCVNYPNYVQQELPFAKATYDHYPEWTWNDAKRLFEPTPSELITARLKEFALLAVKKAQALVEVTRTLTMARYPAWEGMPMQETVYAAKRTQAQRYKDAGYKGDELEVPYVLQYAEFSGLTMRAAADEILLKARFADDVLLKSELFRLKYCGLIRDVNTVAEIDRLVLDFRREFYKTTEVHHDVYPL